jgi:hypothetical protein
MKITLLKKRNFEKKILNNTNNKSVNNKKALDMILPTSNKEWNDSIYLYGSKDKYLSIQNRLTKNLIKKYMNLRNPILDEKIGIFYRDKRKISKLGTQVWLSDIELKHTNDNITINLYIFNRKNNFLIKKLKKSIKNVYLKRLENLKRLKSFIEPTKKIDNRNLFTYIINFYKKKYNGYVNTISQQSNIDNKNRVLNKLYNYLYLNIIKNIFTKELYILHIKQNILLNLLKYRTNQLTILSKIINKIYNKDVKFNIVSLKSYHLDSKILTDIIATKAKDRKNRIAKLLRVSLLKANISSVKKNLIERKRRKADSIQNLVIKNNLKLHSSDKNLDGIIYDNFYNENSLDTNLNSIKLLKNKKISGLRLEASGRLTKRFTAQRSVFKLKYKGTLKNIDSSYKGMSSSLIRNQFKSSVQYNFSKANNRIGAFGIKGWVNSK